MANNSDILGKIDSLVSDLTAALATHAAAKDNVTTLQVSLAKAQADLSADLGDSTTNKDTLAARIPSKQALVNVYETQIAAAQAAAQTALKAVFFSGIRAGAKAGSIARQWREFQVASDRTMIYNFVSPSKITFGESSVQIVLRASAAIEKIDEWIQRFHIYNPEKVPANYQSLLNLPSNWSSFKTAVSAVSGLTLTSPA